MLAQSRRKLSLRHIISPRQAMCSNLVSTFSLTSLDLHFNNNKIAVESARRSHGPPWSPIYARQISCLRPSCNTFLALPIRSKYYGIKWFFVFQFMLNCCYKISLVNDSTAACTNQCESGDRKRSFRTPAGEKPLRIRVSK
jgi:hypothetical protein